MLTIRNAGFLRQLATRRAFCNAACTGPPAHKRPDFAEQRTQYKKQMSVIRKQYAEVSTQHSCKPTRSLHVTGLIRAGSGGCCQDALQQARGQAAHAAGCTSSGFRRCETVCRLLLPAAATCGDAKSQSCTCSKRKEENARRLEQFQEEHAVYMEQKVTRRSGNMPLAHNWPTVHGLHYTCAGFDSAFATAEGTWSRAILDVARAKARDTPATYRNSEAARAKLGETR